MGIIKIAMEDGNNKNTSQETEVVIYAKITNPDGLAQAVHIEQHEQAR